MDVRLITGGVVTDHPVGDLAELLRRDDGLVWVDIPECDPVALQALADVFGCSKAPPARRTACNGSKQPRHRRGHGTPRILRSYDARDRCRGVVVGAWDSRKVPGSQLQSPFQLPHPTECGRRSGSQEHSRCSPPPDSTLEVDGLNAVLLDRPGRLDPGRAREPSITVYW